MLKSLLTLSLVAGVSYIAWQYSCCRSLPPSPDLDAWWGGKGGREAQDTAVRPFKVKFEEKLIRDLQSRLTSRRPLTEPLAGTTMEYGINSRELAAILEYWNREYHFADRERFLNKYPQFKTNIQGLDIHFIRVKPEVAPGTPVIPLLLLHGWPGSVREFYDVIPLLSTPRKGSDFAVEVIVPSLPGYGFSDGAVRPGLGAPEVAVVMRNLMHRLGHKQYYVQGGDWGAVICSAMTTYFPNEVLGLHTNMPLTVTTTGFLKTMIGTVFPSLIVKDHLADRMYPYLGSLQYLLRETGYMHLQATKPDTVGVGLSDSPVGLAAYILEKFAVWTIKDAKQIPQWLSKDGMLDNLMLYWSTNSITTSMRLYAETFNKRALQFALEQYPTEVPTWTIQAKYELSYQSPTILKTRFKNLLNSTVLENGGHFLAFELPEVFSDDVWKALKSFRDWHRNNNNQKKEL